MEISDLSKNRSQIKGIATVFITLCHTTLVFHGFINDFYKLFIVHFMQFGVDLFLLVSGLGCFFSYSNCKNYSRFIRKRFLRILIPYFFVSVPYLLFLFFVLHKEIKVILSRFTLVNFPVFGDLHFWYIFAILSLYLLFPIIYKLSKCHFKVIATVCAIIIICVCLPFWKYMPFGLPVMKEIFFCRIPTFIVGAYLGKIIKDGKEKIINDKYCIVVFIITILLISANYYFNNYEKWTVSRILFLPLSISFALLFSQVFISRKNSFSGLNKFCCFFGAISLPMYLLFEKMIDTITVTFVSLFESINTTLFSFIINISAILLSIIASVILQKVSDKIIHAIQKLPNKRQQTNVINLHG